MSIAIEKRTRALVTDPWGSWVSTTDAPPYTDTTTTEYRVSSSYDVDYLSEYTTVYEQLVETSVASQIDGNESILERQFALLDSAAGQLTEKEIIAAKNTAYSNLRAQIMINSQKTAMALIEKKYKFNKDLQQQDKQLAILDNQIAKSANDSNYVVAQTTALEEQVVDNRKIKALDSMAETYGTFGAGGISVHADMWKAYFDIVVDLAGGAAPTNVTPYKVT